MTALSYDDLVAVATVGLARGPVAITGLAGPAAGHAGVLDPDDPAAAVLDAAALLTAARRAGVVPAAGAACPAPAGPDTAPELSARAAGALEEAAGAAPGLLAGLLTAAAGRGYRAPAPLLPTLLDAAVKEPALRPAVAAVLGARGRWLAAHREDWQRVADLAVAGRPDSSAGPGDAAVWETGRRAERRAYLAALRDRDPGAARDLLAAGWARETGEDRADLLGVLARGLSAADEEFLEAALDDRKAAVRATAAGLLARLPGSAFTRRAADRAAALLRVERRGLGRRLAASLPDDGPDPAAARDGITGPPPPGIGARCWRLTQLIAAAPLAGWVTASGLNPGELTSLAIDGSLAVDVHAGWRLAAVQQASPEWAAALLTAYAPGSTVMRPPAAWPPDRALAALLPPAARAERAAAQLAGLTAAQLTGPASGALGALATGPSQAAMDAITEVARCPGPWPDPLARAVLATLGQLAAVAAPARSAPSRSPAAAELLAAAAASLPVTGPVDHAAALTRLAEEGTCPDVWSLALRRAAGTLVLRRTFLEEIS